MSDLLWQYDELQSPKILEVAKRKEDSPGTVPFLFSSISEYSSAMNWYLPRKMTEIYRE